MDALIGIIVSGLFYRIIWYLTSEKHLLPSFGFWPSIITILAILAGPAFLASAYRYRALAFGLLFGFAGAFLHIALIVLGIIMSMSG